MIDKKPPRISDIDENDDFIEDADEGDVSGGPHPAETGELDTEEGEIAANAMLARQKRSGLLITYGTGAAFFIIAGLISWPHFKHYFVSDTAPKQESVYTPVPESARKNYFTGHDNAASDNNAPAGVNQNIALPDTSTLQPGPVMGATASSPAMAPAVQPSIPSIVPSPAPANGAAQAGGDVSAPPTVPPVVMPSLPPMPTSSPVVPSTDMDAKLAALQGAVDKMAADQKSSQAQIQQLQATLTGLQTQIADMATVKGAPAHQAVPPAQHRAPAAPVSSRGANWTLRSAVSGMALISHAGSNDIQRISVGDMVTGLGKITSISEHDGKWLVQGTSGSIGE